MDFCGSGEMLRAILTNEYAIKHMFEEISGRKVTMVIVAEDDHQACPDVAGSAIGAPIKAKFVYDPCETKSTMQGNNLSVNVEGELHFGEHMEALDGRHDPHEYNGEDD